MTCPADASPSALRSGWYAEVDGRLFSFYEGDGGWWLRSWDPADQAIGFQAVPAEQSFDRPLDPESVRRVVRVGYRGIYRGMDVGVSVLGFPTIWVFASSQQGADARERGMTMVGPDGWRKEIPAGDPDLTVEQTVEEKRPPWSRPDE